MNTELPALKLLRIVFHRNKNVILDRVNLTVKCGETVLLAGKSGAGKTTLARLMVGLEKPDSGSVSVFGRRLDQMPAAELRQLRPRFQMMMQDTANALDPRRRVGKIIADNLPAHFSRAERRQGVGHLLEQTGLSQETSTAFPHQLSGGQRQRVSIARTLACKPDLLIADEPVSALDISISGQILNLLMRSAQRRRMAMVIISHELDIASRIADRIAYLESGQIREEILTARAHEGGSDF